MRNLVAGNFDKNKERRGGERGERGERGDRTVGEDDRVTDGKQRDDVHNVDGCGGAKDRCEALVLAVTAFGQS